MLKTKTQSNVSISGLTYNNLLEDAYNAIKDSDAFKDNFQDFTSNSAERLIVELYAYMATQLANRLDQMGNELFVDTASASGMSRLLKLVGAKIAFPSSASVDVTVSTSSSTNTITFTSGIAPEDSNELGYITSSFKSVKDNSGNTWEFIKRTVGDNGEFVYDYTYPYAFTAPTEDFTLYEGTTQALEYTVRSTDTDILNISGPVIKDSIRVYYKQKVKKGGTSDAYEVVEFTKVDNFFTTAALTSSIGVFTERNKGNGNCELCLKPAEDDLGKELLIMYRTGGGSNGNIAIGAIDKTERFNIIGDSSRVTGSGEYTIYNTGTGAGGKDELTTDEIRATVLQEVRNTKIAVTEEDYEYLLPKYDSEIEIIKCYGEKNEETADLAETYGYYSNPIAVWLLILKYNKAVYDAYMNDVSGLTDRINDISFNTLDVNPRFDEKYQINKACLNLVFTPSEFASHLSKGIYNFPITDDDALAILKEGNSQITLTSSPYVESENSSKRGINCFRKYEAISGTITWAELLDLTSASKGDVYLISDTDINGGKNYRWICIKSFSSKISEDDVLTYWNQVVSSYTYNNFVSDEVESDIQYIQQLSDNTVFNPIYSNVDTSFSGTWVDLVNNESFKYGDDGIKIPEQDGVTLIINGAAISIPGGTIFNNGQKFCDYINSHIAPSTNIIWLKENISTNLTQNPGSLVLPSTGKTSSSFTLVSGGVTNNVTLNISGVTTYSGIKAALDSKLPEAYKAVWVQTNDCWNLGIICANSFTYRDDSASLSDDSGLYVDILGNGETSWPISSESFNLDNSQASEWSDFLNKVSDGGFASFKDGKIVFGFIGGSCSLLVGGETLATQNAFRIFFGLDSSETEEVTKLNKRTFVINYAESATTSLIITMTSEEDFLPEKNLYINIFGKKNTEIKLGSYYENLDDDDISESIKPFLKRNALTNLYSTNYINETLDKYGSNYQLKFSTKHIGAKTFNQLSSGDSPAQVETKNTSNTSMGYSVEGTEFLYMKVDNIEYDGGVLITLNGVEHEVTSLNGYAVFDLSWFSGCEVTDFVSAIVDTVFDGKLYKKDTEDETLLICTSSSEFYSSIDFGDTTANVLAKLFGNEATLVTSEEGQIDVTQIQYAQLALSSTLAIGNNISISVTPIGQSTKVAEINIGYSAYNFAESIGSSNVKDYVTLDNNRIVLKDLSNGTNMTISIAWITEGQYNAWKRMFLDNSWIGDLEYETDEGGNKVAKSGSASISFTNKGSYYIDYRKDDGYYLVVEDTGSFPCGNIYFHMYEDFSEDHIVEDGVLTDEYIWNNLMTDRKVMIAEHVYKQPRFVPFDLSITCYLPNNEAYSQVDYEAEIKEFLRNEHGIYSDTIGESIAADDIVLEIKNKFSKVKKVVVNYLGYNMLNSNTYESELTAQFNQKLILASTETSIEIVRNAAGVLIQDLVVSHGLKIEIKYN